MTCCLLKEKEELLVLELLQHVIHLINSLQWVSSSAYTSFPDSDDLFLVTHKTCFISATSLIYLLKTKITTTHRDH